MTKNRQWAPYSIGWDTTGKWKDCCRCGEYNLGYCWSLMFNGDIKCWDCMRECKNEKRRQHRKEKKARLLNWKKT